MRELRRKVLYAKGPRRMLHERIRRGPLLVRENLVRDVNMACRSRGVLACHEFMSVCRLGWVYFLCGPAARFSRGTRFCRTVAGQFRVAISPPLGGDFH